MHSVETVEDKSGSVRTSAAEDSARIPIWDVTGAWFESNPVLIVNPVQGTVDRGYFVSCVWLLSCARKDAEHMSFCFGLFCFYCARV